MRFPAHSIAYQILAGLTALCIAAAWLVAVPAMLTPLNFAALAGLLTGLLWVGLMTFRNAQSPHIIGHVIHAAEQTAAHDRPRTKA
jgi:hypothetical protein